jgi:tRNA-uridine 2-sulfurtransferase
MNSKKEKVFVGMSGGVDSSVSAALLLEAGYDVWGVFIKVWQADFLPCTWRDERREAMRVAAHLGIPFLTLDLEREYKEGVVDYMIREYERGRVPNPDVMCNKEVKFGGFLNFAKSHGADKVATGHYARTSFDPQSSRTSLHCGKDKEKDQSYFLWTLTQSAIESTLFPVGHLEKREVRLLADRFGLPNAKKKDSQGLCFMGPVDMREFLSHYVHASSGEVVSQEGKIIGSHEGALFFTVGQRHGFHIFPEHQTTAPLYVIAKDMPKNQIIVAPRLPELASQDVRVTVGVTSLVWNDIRPVIDKSMSARVRYRGALTQAEVTVTPEGECRAVIVSPKDPIALGQSVVFYDGERVVGGGVIDSVI